MSFIASNNFLFYSFWLWYFSLLLKSKAHICIFFISYFMITIIYGIQQELSFPLFHYFIIELLDLFKGYVISIVCADN